MLETTRFSTHLHSWNSAIFVYDDWLIFEPAQCATRAKTQPMAAPHQHSE